MHVTQVIMKVVETPNMATLVKVEVLTYSTTISNTQVINARNLLYSWLGYWFKPHSLPQETPI